MDGANPLGFFYFSLVINSTTVKLIMKRGSHRELIQLNRIMKMYMGMLRNH